MQKILSVIVILFLLTCLQLFTAQNSFAQVAAPNKKLLLHDANHIMPDYFANNVDEIDALPFEGVVLHLADDANFEFLNRGTSVIPVSQFKSTLAGVKIAQSQLKRVRNNFIAIRLPQKGTFTSQTPIVAQNFANLAEAARDAGLHGIIYDNEDYEQDMWNPSISCPGKTTEECQIIAAADGQKVMEAVIERWPNVKMMVYNATVFAHGPTYQEYIEAPNPRFLVMGAYAVGMSLATIGTEATFIDGGEQEFYIHGLAGAERSYNIRKNLLPDRTPLIPADKKAQWKQKVSIGYGMFDEIPGGPLIDSTRWKDDIITHVKTSDEYVWVFSHYHNWVGTQAQGKLVVTDEWLAATKAGRVAAGLSEYPAISGDQNPCATKSTGDANCDSKIDLVDYELWRREFLALATTKDADFNSDSRVDLIDYETWRRSFI